MLESLASFDSDFWQEGSAIEPDIERSLLNNVAKGSPTVNGILRHMTDDIANAVVISETVFFHLLRQ